MTEPTFDQLPLSADTLNAIQQAGYQTPTPIQLAAVPVMLEGKDAILQAQTGTGKTAAFALPIVEKVDVEAGRIQALVLAPTRELASQVAKEVTRMGTGRGVTATAVYGGTSFEKQYEALEAVQVVVATPGRLLDLRRRKKIDFSQIRYFGLDEADEMLSMGFEEDVMDIVHQLPRKKQSFLCSATYNPSVQRLASNFTRKPEVINVSSDEIGARNVTHRYFKVPSGAKLEALRRVMVERDIAGGLIFANTRAATFMVQSYLLGEGYTVGVLNGELSQAEREKALHRMREDHTDFLVATDVAARGIDISGLPSVINYDMPEAAEVYVHRTGRTGRAGQFGVAYSLVAPEDIAVFHQLIKFYKLDLEECPLPSAAQLAAAQAKRSVERVLEVLDVDNNLEYAEHMPLAKELIASSEVRTIAKLIAHFTVTNKNGAPVPVAVQEPEAPTEESFTRLAINIGLDVFSDEDTCREVMADLGGLDVDDIGEVTLADRSAELEVRESYWRSFVQAVEGVEFDDATLAVSRVKG